MENDIKKCPTCGGKVYILGNTTKHFKPIEEKANGFDWIEFKKQAPPRPSENYLVFKDGEIKISIFRADWNMFHCDINRNINEPYVTHWSELPKPPNLKI